MSVYLSPALKQDLLSINDIPDTKSSRAVELLKFAFQGRLEESQLLEASDEMQVEVEKLRTSIDALSFYVSELVRVAVPKEVIHDRHLSIAVLSDALVAGCFDHVRGVWIAGMSCFSNC